MICIGFIWRPGLASAHLHCPHATMHAVADPSALQARLHRWSALWPGLALAAAVAATAILAARLPALQRSEEHTSELPSLMRISYAVFCLNKTTIKLTSTST